MSPEGLLGSEVQPRCRAEDCIWLNCAVVFYTIILNVGILDKAGGTSCEKRVCSRGLTAGILKKNRCLE